MIIAATPPSYDADVCIGYDSRDSDFIARRLNCFRTARARVVAHGKGSGTQLALDFPYAESAFRDTFGWLADSGYRSLLLQSQAKEGS